MSTPSTAWQAYQAAVDCGRRLHGDQRADDRPTGCSSACTTSPTTERPPRPGWCVQPPAAVAYRPHLAARLGAAWTADPPRIPLFEDVLQDFGGRVVLAVEAKLDAAYVPMMAMVEQYGLQDSVIVKAHFKADGGPRPSWPVTRCSATSASVADLTPDLLGADLRAARSAPRLPGHPGRQRQPLPRRLLRHGGSRHRHPGLDVPAASPCRRAALLRSRRAGARSAPATATSPARRRRSPPIPGRTRRSPPARCPAIPATGTFAPQFTADRRDGAGGQGQPAFHHHGATRVAVGTPVRTRSVSTCRGPPRRSPAGTTSRWPSAARTIRTTSTGRARATAFTRSCGPTAHWASTGIGTVRWPANCWHPKSPRRRCSPVSGRPCGWTSRPSSVTLSRIDTGAAVTATGVAPGGGYVHLGRSSTNGVAAFRALSVT